MSTSTLTRTQTENFRITATLAEFLEADALLAEAIRSGHGPA
ncbi:hypothetical protein [Georgenia yuyongxinii]|nr:hypothetical protein [Georgenia yuyongxinii]